MSDEKEGEEGAAEEKWQYKNISEDLKDEIDECFEIFDKDKDQ